ncbi:FkbM family methyltransferase [Mycolicibacter acidiphilus]|uniref:FkbM family methyltransferase n=1 Tax=Mycolicibacter acidiphilus TaxID=2835306 RepID=UPI0020230917|nr:FkbM family methyltransferase [Mycolicibacter acidiphilus]
MSALRDLLAPSRLTHVVDVGAKAGHGNPPYATLMAQGECHVTGFEPQPHALADLLAKCGPNENYLPYAVGDGGEHTLNLCRSDGMTSLLTPIPENLGLLGNLGLCAEVVQRVPVQTQRLDDIPEIEHLDFLKIDIQGGELAVFQNGRQKLAECVAIQTEVSFAPGYEGQPSMGDIDVELRSQGFIPHCFAEIHKQPILPVRRPCNQIFDADLVYVRDFFRPDEMTDEQLKHLALVAHHCYKSFDLAIRCVQLLEERGAVEVGTLRRYTEAPIGVR